MLVLGSCYCIAYVAFLLYLMCFCDNSHLFSISERNYLQKFKFPFLIHETVNRCPQLSAPVHGSLELCSNLPGQTCLFSCDKGHVLTGSTTRTCNSDGTWTGTQPQCNGEDKFNYDDNSEHSDCLLGTKSTQPGKGLMGNGSCTFLLLQRLGLVLQ